MLKKREIDWIKATLAKVEVAASYELSRKKTEELRYTGSYHCHLSTRCVDIS